MKKKNMRLLALLLALLLAAVLALSACGGGNKDDSSGGGETTPPASTDADTPGTTPAEPSEPAGTKAEPVKDFTTYQTAANEMETFLVFNNEGQATQDVLANCMAGLLEVTPKGTLQPAIATEWGTEDGGLTWTFKLRDDVTWVDVNGNERASRSPTTIPSSTTAARTSPTSTPWPWPRPSCPSVRPWWMSWAWTTSRVCRTPTCGTTAPISSPSSSRATPKP